jgi:hypothetical protein
LLLANAIKLYNQNDNNGMSLGRSPTLLACPRAGSLVRQGPLHLIRSLSGQAGAGLAGGGRE